MEPKKPITEPNPAETAVVSSGEAAKSTVLGDFELRREIGRGGMGTVYEAWQVSLQRTVALKVLAPHVASTPKAVSRFRREAQAAAKLHHTHIVPIFAQGEAQGSYFYAMELVDGDSLHSVISNLREKYRPETVSDQAETVVIPRQSGSSATATRKVSQSGVSDSGVRGSDARHPKGAAFGDAEFFNDAARHLSNVADALEYAHVNGVIHRDIKPHNLLFGRDGRLRISDFGLARLAEQPGVTMTGEVLGSPLYMSPEQILGDPNAVDHRTDIYSLGATMYEWLTLTPPYPGETRERVISRIMSSEARPPHTENSAVPQDLETICLKAIERDVNRRYQSVGEFRDDLRRFLLNRPILARRAGLPLRAARFLVRHQIAALLSLAVILGGILSVALYAKNRTAQIEKKAATEAKTAVVAAEEKVQVVQQQEDYLSEALGLVFSAVPGGSQVVESVARGDVTIPKVGLEGLDPRRLTASILTPGALARLSVDRFFYSIMPPDWPKVGEGSSNASKIEAAIDRWAAGELEPALVLVEEYATAIPSDAFAMQMRIALYAALGRFDEMGSEADALLRLDSSKNGYLWRGLAYLLQGKIEPSISDLNRAVAQDRQSSWARLFRGLALLQQPERSAEARELFQSVLKQELDSVQVQMALVGLARTYTAEGEYAAALPEVEKALKIDPKNAHALTIRGECKAASGDYKGALADFDQAMKIAGKDPEILARWVSVHLVVRNQEKASASATTDIKSRHGTETDDSLAPPVFNWLSPRKRMPEGNRGTLLPRNSAPSSLRLGLPVP